MKNFLLIVVMFTCLGGLNAQQVTKISGKVSNSSGEPVYGANVMIEGTIDGATTEKDGSFEFETKKTGDIIILILAQDFAEKRIPVSLQPGVDVVQTITLSKSEYKTEEIVVTASSFTSGITSNTTLTPLEIVRIPGADADIYRAITTFPGTNQVDEGSRIAVRGGDPEEVLTYLDGASIYNPFLFDGVTNTSSYSTINVWGLSGINFTSGGFGAKYGNVLSAVLDLQSFDMPRSTGIFAIIGLANAGISGVTVSNDGKFGATFEAGYFNVEPFVAINGSVGEYSPMPTAKSFGGTISLKLNQTDILKLYTNYKDDKIGIFSQSPDYSGFFNSKSRSLFSNLKYKMAVSSVGLLQLSASVSSNEQDVNYGVIDNTNKLIYYKLRGDYSSPVSDGFDVAAGMEYEFNESKINGVVPVYSYNIKPGAPSLNLDASNNTGRLGSYLEAKYRITDNLFSIGGLRSDYHTFSKKINFDPRLSLVYVFDKFNSLKAATGIYHQYPQIQYYSRTGNDNLDAERSIHYILGYEHNNDNFIFRLEGFYKDYANLVRLSEQSGYITNSGEGFSRGMDLFLKYRKPGLFTGWISYSFVDSKRKDSGNSGWRSANYDITHNLSIVGTFTIDDYWTAGLSYKISTGKPFTPVVSSAFDSTLNVYVPEFAPVNSDRFPVYHRVDLNLQRYFILFKKFVVVFASLNNALNTDNLYSYTYNFDYSERLPVRSTNNRSFYFGFGIQL